MPRSLSPYEMEPDDLKEHERSEKIGRRDGEYEHIQASRVSRRNAPELDELEEIDEDDVLDEEVDLDARAYGDGPDA